MSVSSQDRQIGIDRYIASLKVQSGSSRLPVLLVEGADDKAFFDCLKAKIGKRLDYNLPINVVTASDRTVKSRVDIEDNRERVQAIAEAISKLENDANTENRKVFNKFLGFVDSEFERYDVRDNLIIPIPNQEPPDRRGNSLRRTKGHSVENYLFQFDLMEQQLRRYCNAPEFTNSALAHLKRHFGETISIACAVSLAARDEEFIRTVRKTLDGSHWRILVHNDSSNPSIELDRERFEDCIQNYILEPEDKPSGWNPSWQEEKATKFFDKLEDYLKVEQQPDAERWLCHGHIGMHLIRYAYAMLMWKSSGYAQPHPACIQDMFTEHWIDQNKDKEHLWVEIYSNPKDDADDVPISCFFELERKREVLNNLIDLT